MVCYLSIYLTYNYSIQLLLKGLQKLIDSMFCRSKQTFSFQNVHCQLLHLRNQFLNHCKVYPYPVLLVVCLLSMDYLIHRYPDRDLQKSQLQLQVDWLRLLEHHYIHHYLQHLRCKNNPILFVHHNLRNHLQSIQYLNQPKLQNRC